MDWTQVLGYAAKAANVFKKAVDTLAEERDIVLPESVLNTALATFAMRSKTLHALSFQLHDDWFEMDLVYVHQGIEFGINASFDVDNMTLDQHKQTIVLRERRPVRLQTRRFASTRQQLGFALWSWWCRRFKKTEPLIYALQKTEGITIKDGIYRFDFSPYLRRRPALIATLYALEINTIRITEGELYLRGSADLKSLNLLQELYKLLPTEDKITTVREVAKFDRKQAEQEADAVIDKILAARFKEGQQQEP